MFIDVSVTGTYLGLIQGQSAPSLEIILHPGFPTKVSNHRERINTLWPRLCLSLCEFGPGVFGSAVQMHYRYVRLFGKFIMKMVTVYCGKETEPINLLCGWNVALVTINVGE